MSYQQINNILEKWYKNFSKQSNAGKDIKITSQLFVRDKESRSFILVK